MKTSAGLFFEDYRVGQVIDHAVPRTVGTGERALYHALYPARHALYSSDHFAQNCGLPQSPLDDLIAFHVVFGKTVPDISLNAVANLGYAEARWLRPVYPGDTLRARSTVIGVKQNSSGKTGVVWVRSEGFNQADEMVMSFVRWVMVRKRDAAAPAPQTVVPTLGQAVLASDLSVPYGLNFANYNIDLAGSSYLYSDYTIGEVIDHVDGVTLSEAEHMMATRLWQNTAKVHFDATARPNGLRLIYGGHVISMARALSFKGWAMRKFWQRSTGEPMPILALQGIRCAHGVRCWISRKPLIPLLVHCVCGWWRTRGCRLTCAEMTANITAMCCWI